MSLSVVITAYNLVKYITQAVESALANGATEVIVVNDGSTDGTLAVLEKLAAADPRVRIITQPNGGSASARNTGARAAKGKYLAFLDGDDFFEPNSVAPLLAILENNPTAICAYGQWKGVNAEGKLLSSKMKLTSRYSGFVLKDLLVRCFLVMGSWVMRTETFLSIGAFNNEIGYAEDWDFLCRLAMQGDFIASDICVLCYRLIETSKSAATQSGKEDKVLATVDRVFANTKLKTYFSDDQLRRLKQKSRACALLGISTRSFWERHYAASLGMAWRAMQEYPLMAPRIFARVGLNCALVLAKSVKPMLRPVKSFVIRIQYRVFCLFARDITPLVEISSIMVIAPHPDDDVLGAGTAIMRARGKGRDVTVIVVTDGSASANSNTISKAQLVELRRKEGMQGNEVMGVPSGRVHFLDFHDGGTTTQIDAITEALRARIEQDKPQVIFIPHCLDSHEDHRNVVSAVARLIETGVVRCRVFQYPVWIWPFNAVRSLLRYGFNLRYVNTAGFRDRKKAALAKHRSQCENLTGEKDWFTLPEYFYDIFFTGRELYFEMTVPKAGER